MSYKSVVVRVMSSLAHHGCLVELPVLSLVLTSSIPAIVETFPVAGIDTRLTAAASLMMTVTTVKCVDITTKLISSGVFKNGGSNI